MLALFAAVAQMYIEKNLITYELVAHDRANEPDPAAKGGYANAYANCQFVYLTQLNSFITRITGVAEDSFNNFFIEGFPRFNMWIVDVHNSGLCGEGISFPS